ncbi:MAG: hypothetical protein K2J54_03940, partial [Clostridia bacterium]|nr:hypothetical protein [Clostridia bacterium]
MDNKMIKTIVYVIVGLALLTILYSFCSLIFNAITARDQILMNPKELTNEIKEILNLATWLLVALVCLLVPTLVCYCFSLFGKNKIMTVVSAVMSLFVVVTCIAFFFVLRDNAFINTTTYTVASTAYPEIIQLLAASAVTCAFFTYESVFILKHFIKVIK